MRSYIVEIFLFPLNYFNVKDNALIIESTIAYIIIDADIENAY